jgi:hypothetical protein
MNCRACRHGEHQRAEIGVELGELVTLLRVPDVGRVGHCASDELGRVPAPDAAGQGVTARATCGVGGQTPARRWGETPVYAARQLPGEI